MRALPWGVLGFVCLLVCAGHAVAQEAGVADRPDIWRNADARQELLALRMARLDGARKLIGRIYGLKIDGQTEVVDLAAISDEFGTALEGNLRGFRETRTLFHEDGSCQVELEMQLKDAIESVRRTFRRVADGKLPVEEEEIQLVEKRNRVREFRALGNGALPGTDGMRKIQAQRAAEMDAQRRIAERLVGIQVNAGSQVKHFALAHDRVKSVVAASLKGVKFTDVKDDGRKVEVTGELTLKNTIRRIARSYRENVDGGALNVTDLQNIATSEEFKDIVEVGSAAYAPKGSTVEAPATATEAKIVERVLAQAEN